VDAVTRYHIEQRIGVIPFLDGLRSSLREGTFQPSPVKQAVIPKKDGSSVIWGSPSCGIGWRRWR
jgi:RNA-directed DNA polymerase